jgi:hypothetical protein
MANEIYEGQFQIEETLRELLNSLGLKLDEVEWRLESSDVQRNFDLYTLRVMAGGEKHSIQGIPREQIEDYPGRAETEILNSHLVELVRKFES